jgi:small subunit ribosomal protein S18
MARQQRKRECYFTKKNIKPDYKDAATLQRYVTPWGKIKESKDTGVCAKCQRILSRSIKNARYLALMPYSTR